MQVLERTLLQELDLARLLEARLILNVGRGDDESHEVAGGDCPADAVQALSQHACEVQDQREVAQKCQAIRDSWQH